MSDLIERDKAIEAIAEHLMGEAVLEYSDASDNIEDWKEIGEAILENIPPAEVIPKGSDEASLAYAEGWKNGEEAERSRHKIAMSDYIERKSIRNLYSCLNPNDRVLVGQVLIDINAIPSAEPSWADALAELHERFYALEKEIRKTSAEISAMIRKYVDRPKGEWTPIGAVCEVICKHCIKANGCCQHHWKCPLLTEIAKLIESKEEQSGKE